MQASALSQSLPVSRAFGLPRTEFPHPAPRKASPPDRFSKNRRAAGSDSVEIRESIPGPALKNRQKLETLSQEGQALLSLLGQAGDSLDNQTILKIFDFVRLARELINSNQEFLARIPRVLKNRLDLYHLLSQRFGHDRLFPSLPREIQVPSSYDNIALHKEFIAKVLRLFSQYAESEEKLRDNLNLIEAHHTGRAITGFSTLEIAVDLLEMELGLRVNENVSTLFRTVDPCLALRVLEVNTEYPIPENIYERRDWKIT